MNKKQQVNSTTGAVSIQLPLLIDEDKANSSTEWEGPTTETGEFSSLVDGVVSLDQEQFLQSLSKAEGCDDLHRFRAAILGVKETVVSAPSDQQGEVRASDETKIVSFRRDILIGQFDQMLESYTLERALYYLKRLKKGVSESKTSGINDLNLLRWQDYDDIITDSLWVVEKRDTSGAHLGWYWGNFIPQIPHQMLLRYTRKRDWVVDTFVGSGTTLIECRRLGRNGVGVELNAEVARKARELVEQEANTYNVTTEVVLGDSRQVSYTSILRKHDIRKVQLVIMHPPYHDIIKFSSDPNDLSNASDTQRFLKMFGEAVDNVCPYLETGRYLVVVIGDKYNKGEWIPLGFYCMNEVVQRGFLLKSIIVKNFDETRAKRNQKELWRYRALVGGFYVFKHEYVLLFQKKGRG